MSWRLIEVGKSVERRELFHFVMLHKTEGDGEVGKTTLIRMSALDESTAVAPVEDARCYYKLLFVEDDELEVFLSADAKETHKGLCNRGEKDPLPDQERILYDVMCHVSDDPNVSEDDIVTRVAVDWLKRIFMEGDSSEYPKKFYADAVLFDSFLLYMNLVFKGLTQKQHQVVVDELLLVCKGQEEMFKDKGPLRLALVPAKGVHDVDVPSQYEG